MIDNTVIHRAIAFVDLRGFSRYTTLHGDRAAARVHRHLATTVRDAALKADVELVKFLGDGAMLAADDAELLGRFVRNLTETLAGVCPLPLSSGLADGPVVLLEDGDYLGATVNAAARACSAAKPGELRAVDQRPARPSSRERVIASLLARPA